MQFMANLAEALRAREGSCRTRSAGLRGCWKWIRSLGKSILFLNHKNKINATNNLHGRTNQSRP